jgi:TetR/AcrR family transcriptional regulator, transcriptional repressor of aconitase
VPKVTEEYLSARRGQIMQAAIECFSREGFHRTTMQDIIGEAGLSVGSIYRYFASKEEIVAAIAKKHHAPEAAVLDGAAADMDLSGLLTRLAEVSISRLTDPAEQRWRRVTIQLWAEALRDPEIMAVVRSGLDRPIEQLTELFRRAKDAGQLTSPIDPVGAAHVCASLFQGLVLQQAWNPDLDVEVYLNAVSTLVELIISPRR